MLHTGRARNARKDFMSTSTNVLVKTGPDAVSLLEPKPLDEAVWKQWVAKGKAQDLRSQATFVRVATLVFIAALVVAVAMWFRQ